jgi:hypothetical protein
LLALTVLGFSFRVPLTGDGLRPLAVSGKLKQAALNQELETKNQKLPRLTNKRKPQPRAAEALSISTSALPTARLLVPRALVRLMPLVDLF